MRWLFIIDPIEGLKPATDTSLALINQARSQGVEVDSATLDMLYHDNRVMVQATTAAGSRHQGALDDYDLIFMRKEPPYDLAFHYATQLFSLSSTRVINSPESLRNFNEKLIALPFSPYMPTTFVGSDPELIENFVNKHKRCVIKSLDSFQGKAVKRIDAGETEVIREFTANGKYPVMVQRFLDNVYAGDKRVIMLGDRVLGAAMRKPRSGYHANFASSEALKTELTPKEQAAVDAIGPWLVEQGIYFTGLDFIDEHLTEINITCPTGIIQISELDGTDLPKEIVDYFIAMCG